MRAAKVENGREYSFILPVGPCCCSSDSILHAAASIKKLVEQVEVPAGLPVISFLSLAHIRKALVTGGPLDLELASHSFEVEIKI